MVLRQINVPAGIYDRRVTGTTAEITREATSHGRFIEFVMVFEQPGHRHNEPRCAEATLRTVMFDHRPLHGTWFGFATQAFDSDDMSAIKLKQELNAGVDGPIDEPTT